MTFSVLYGIEGNNIDVTEIALQKCYNKNIISIPSGELNRSLLFTDPLHGILKIILIRNNDTGIVTSYDHNKKIFIDIDKNEITCKTENTIVNNKKLDDLHTKLTLKYGSFREEYPEQIMAVTYLTGHEKVLEIGGNIGRNSMIIGSILNSSDNENFVCLECDANIANQLRENRDANSLKFHIGVTALSKRPLIQKGWDTMVSEELLPGYKRVNTLSYEELIQKYNIDFDTLVLDCEGAFYYILMDMPEILDNINLIIMENDYHDISHKQYIDKILSDNGFYVDYSQSGGWGPCYKNFFEVWKLR